jgi:hypothetical protein
MEQNRRKFPRAKYPCSLTLWQGGKFETVMTNTSNIGAGGVLVSLNQSFMIGAKVEVKINFSDKESFGCDGLVLRCQPNKEDPEEEKAEYSVAIGFEGLDEPKVSYLRELVDKLITTSESS